MDEANGLIASDISKEKGGEFRDAYQSADPFPHIVIDEFLPPKILDACLRAFPVGSDDANEKFDRKQERLKESFHPDILPPFARGLFYSFNSKPFIRVVE